MVGGEESGGGVSGNAEFAAAGNATFRQYGQTGDLLRLQLLPHCLGMERNVGVNTALFSETFYLKV